MWLLVVVAAALAGIAAVGAADERRVAFTLGVTPERDVASVGGKRTVSQAPIDVPAPFERVMLQVGADRRSSPPLAVEVRSSPGSTPLGSGVVAGGYPPGDTYVTAPVGRVDEGQAVAVTVRALGPGRVGLSGGPAQASRASRARVDGRPRDADLTLVFLRDRPRSALGLAPEMFERAALWRPGAVSAALLAVLLGAAAVGAPLLLGRAIRSASVDEPAAQAAGDSTTTV